MVANIPSKANQARREILTKLGLIYNGMPADGHSVLVIRDRRVVDGNAYSHPFAELTWPKMSGDVWS